MIHRHRKFITLHISKFTLVAAFSKEMADADGRMLAEYGAMDAMEPLPQSTVGRELEMEEEAEIDKHQPW